MYPRLCSDECSMQSGCKPHTTNLVGSSTILSSEPVNPDQDDVYLSSKGTLEKVKNFAVCSSLGYRIKASFLKGCCRPNETVSRDGEYKQQFVSFVAVHATLGGLTVKTISPEKCVALIRETIGTENRHMGSMWNLELQVHFYLKSRTVAIRTCKETKHVSAPTKASDSLKAFLLVFWVVDVLALLRLHDFILESFEITNVKPLKGDHLFSAVGRITSNRGKTKFTIENGTWAWIVLADVKVHTLDSFQNIKMERTAICNLTLGNPPSKVYGRGYLVYGNIRAVASRSAD
nr:LOW QUALITY PROTEIN: RNA-binding protein PNO1-like [Oryctolagus cuniculus]